MRAAGVPRKLALRALSRVATMNDDLKNILMRRMVTPREIGATVAFLTSDAGASLSGHPLQSTTTSRRLEFEWKTKNEKQS